ncbi:hypothetical protein NQ317_013508, partial [Molorchus minor]
MQPIIVVSRLFGLFPVEYVKNGVQYKLKWSTGFAIYSYLLSLVLTVATLLGVANDLEEDEEHSIRMKTRKGRIVTCCDIIIVIVIVAFASLSLPFKLKKFWKLLKYLNSVDAIVPMRSCRVLRKSSIYVISSIFGTLAVVITFDMTSWAYTTRDTDNTGTFFKNYTSFYLLYCILIMQEVFFWHAVFFIKVRIAQLNRTLAGMEGEGADKFLKKVFIMPYSGKVCWRGDSGRTGNLEVYGMEKLSIS